MGSVAVIAMASTMYAVPRLSYVPRVPLQVFRNFVDLIQAGDVSRGLSADGPKSMVGSTLAAFETNIPHQLGVDAFPTNRPTN
jgi:hypothetical protein